MNLKPTDAQIITYTRMLEKHISNVQEASKFINVDRTRLNNHDNSKWGIEEFNAYAMYYFPDPSQVKQAVINNYNVAWLHHLHTNDHHWQYWMIPDGPTLQMPNDAILEMVADWMGSEMSHNNSWDMTEWLNYNLPKIVLHDDSRRFLNTILSGLGYEIP